jgi:hypothetical protein
VRADDLVRLTVSLDDQRVLAEGESTIALPANTFEHTDPEQTVSVEATLEDGSPLPEYVVFDPDTMTFEVNGAEAMAAGEEQIVVLLVGKDTAGNSASGVFVINVDDVDEASASVAAEEQFQPGQQLPTGDAQDLVEGETLEEEALDGQEEEVDEQSEREGSNEQADGRKNLDLQLQEASRYNFVDRIEQLLEDIKNLFT